MAVNSGIGLTSKLSAPALATTCGLDPATVLLSAGRLDENVIRVDHDLDLHAGGDGPVIHGVKRYLNMEGLAL
jgi:hypothetical protein